MVLSQAEQEGYSVFVVRRAGGLAGDTKGKDVEMSEGEGWGDGGVGRLPECLADNMAVELGEPVGRSGGFGTNQTSNDSPSVDPSSVAGPSSPPSKSRRKRQEDLAGVIPADDPFLQQPQSSSSAQRNTFGGADTLEEDDDGDLPVGASDFAHHTRAYDDEDAAFQAALRASMEDVPVDWVAPDFKKKKANAVSDGKRELPTPPVAAPVATQNWRPAGGAAEVKQPAKEEDMKIIDEPEAPLSPTEELSQGKFQILMMLQA